MSASTGFSSSGHQTGAPVAFATGATAPMWSKWVWVTRIASTVTPMSSSSARIRSGSSPGSTTIARSDPSLRAMKQFSPTWPTVSMRTSMSASGVTGALRLPLGPLLRLLAEMAVVEEAVHQERHRDVEAEHQDRDHRGGDRLLPEHGKQTEEEERGDPALLQGIAPAGRLRDALALRSLLLLFLLT